MIDFDELKNKNILEIGCGFGTHAQEIIKNSKKTLEHSTVLYGKKLGTTGLASSFSFYYGHHISTIEGGMVGGVH